MHFSYKLMLGDSSKTLLMNLPQAEQELEALLDYLKHNRGCDLTGYKRSTLVRRFRHQM